MARTTDCLGRQPRSSWRFGLLYAGVNYIAQARSEEKRKNASGTVRVPVPWCVAEKEGTNVGIRLFSTVRLCNGSPFVGSKAVYLKFNETISSDTRPVRFPAEESIFCSNFFLSKFLFLAANKTDSYSQLLPSKAENDNLASRDEPIR